MLDKSIKSAMMKVTFTTFPSVKLSEWVKQCLGHFGFR